LRTSQPSGTVPTPRISALAPALVAPTRVAAPFSDRPPNTTLQQPLAGTTNIRRPNTTLLPALRLQHAKRSRTADVSSVNWKHLV
jgi:hypothetical protein